MSIVKAIKRPPFKPVIDLIPRGHNVPIEPIQPPSNVFVETPSPQPTGGDDSGGDVPL